MSYQELLNGELYGAHRGKLNSQLSELYSIKLEASQVLTKTNTQTYNPTGDYHPVPKIYVDQAFESWEAIYNPGGSSGDIYDRANHFGVQPATSITQDSDHRFVADSDISNWNQKADDFGTIQSGFNKPFGTTAGTVSEGNHIHTKADVGLGNVDNTSDLNKPVSYAAQAALDLKQDKIGAVSWPVSSWVPGTYDAGAMVRDGAWTMIANTETSDTPSPQPDGNASYILDDFPTWEDLVITDSVMTGVRIRNLTETYQVTAVRVWLPDVTVDAHYRVITVDNISGVMEIGNSFLGTLLTIPGWLNVSIEPVFVSPGDDITIFLSAQNYATSSNYNHPWIYIGANNKEEDPGLGNTEIRGDNSLLRINKTDNDSVDRTSELLQAGAVGSIIRLAEEADLSAFLEYEVISISDLGTYYLYSTVLVNTGANGSPTIGARCQLYFTVPIATDTDYVRIAGHYTSFPSLEGQIKFGEGVLTNTEDAYGVDVYVQKYVASLDWDLVAYSASISGGSSAAPGGIYRYDKGISTPTEIITEDPTYTQIADIVVDNAPPGDYEFKWSLQYSYTSASSSVFVRYSTDGGLTWVISQLESQDSTDKQLLTYFFPRSVVTADTLQLRLEMAKGAGGPTLTAYFANVVIDQKS